MSKIELIHGDCLEEMKKIPDKSIDLVLTDPPYGMSFVSNHRKEKYNSIVGDDKFPLWIFDEFKRIAKCGIYVFCRWDNLHAFPKPKSVIAWVKNNWSMGDLKHEHGRQWEAITFYNLQYHKFIKRIPDVIRANRTGNKLHPTEKPVELIKKLIECNVCETVLDPFIGSGTTGVACVNTNRKFIGIELDENYFNIAQNRINECLK